MRSISYDEVEFRPHLVVAWPGDFRAAIQRRGRLMVALVEALEPKGEYTVVLVDHGGGTTIHCSFDAAADALRLAKAVHATEIRQFAGHRTQRAFVLDDEAERTIQEALATQRRVDREVRRIAGGRHRRGRIGVKSGGALH